MSSHRAGGQSSSYMPFFSTDQQTGTFGLNSEGSVANAKLQQLLIDRDRPRLEITPEHKIHALRQKAVDIYYEGEKYGDIVELNSQKYVLPKVTSPQPIYIGQEDTSPSHVKAQRSHQFRGFHNSFLESYGQHVYNELDEAMLSVTKRKAEIAEKKQGSLKNKIFRIANSRGKYEQWTTKESRYIFEPLHEAIQYLNKVYAQEQVPLQLRWRQVWETPDRKVEDIYMIFPNNLFDAKQSMSSWKGMSNAVDKDVFR